MNKLSILNVDDWLVLYVNGKSEYQGHSIAISELSRYTPIESIEIRDAEGEIKDFVTKNGFFPMTLDDAIRIDRTIKFA